MGATLAVEEWGEGDPLVLLHGLGATRAIWTRVVPPLSQRWRVVSLDVPGFGESEPAGPGFELEAVADRIREGLAARDLDGPFDLVGHSLGAGVALTLAAVWPQSVRRLVLSAPAGFASYPQAGVRVLAAGINQVLAARRVLAPLTDLAWGRRLLLASVAAEPAAMSPTQARFIVEASAGARRMSEGLATIASADLRPLLREAPAPLGLIWGIQDRTVPVRLAKVITEVRADAEIELIERAGHVAMVERPEAYVTVLEAVLARLG